MNTQVQLFSTKLSIITLPRKDYWIFSSGVQKLLHRVADFNYSDYEYISDSDTDDEGQLSHTDNSTVSSAILSTSISGGDRVKDDDDDDGLFFHVAFTPQECTIMCSEQLAQEYFQGPLDAAGKLDIPCQMLSERYLALMVAGDGLNMGERVLELTEPLSSADISLFFLSNYFSDIVLIPESARDQVVSILEMKGFFFSNVSQSYVVESTEDLARLKISDPTRSQGLDDRAFQLFDNAHIEPEIEGTKLLLTGARAGHSGEVITTTANALAKCDINDVSEDFADYFAITRTSSREVALLLPKSSRIRARLGYQSKYLAGSTSDVVVPIKIDLSKLPVDSKGIVAGIALKLLKKADEGVFEGPFEMSYLSMAKSAIVMIPKENAEAATRIFQK